ncbi:MOSC domain-containing protein [Blastopirellula marina]|uniref:MOSC domain-containing protein n=1 Tax=Blastopirellula marina TaxID=124 RepID=A0A2S8G905_9BACT|nr:MOSC domain-containing protein [Blastopirellula marina]PQO40946.1 MOSC domain-containing protein [Blastopirellula marina]PTL45828.1 MOSC domain-containing protein [Blastopirellula marina]
MPTHLTLEQLNDGILTIESSPQDAGTLEAIVIRPVTDARVSLDKCELSPQGGVHGDNWALGCWKSLPDGSPHPDVQVAIMNSRTIDLIAGEAERWPLAGDNLFVDLDLSENNLPPGTKLSVGDVTLEITEIPHNGCKKFAERFGTDAVKFVNSPVGKQMHLRGIYAKIVQAGTVRVGDVIRKLRE